MLRVKKNNGKLQDFDKYKIEYSINAAAKQANEPIKDLIVKRIANSIEEDLLSENTPVIEADELAKLVENKLMQSKYKDTAWHYITYHYDRQQERLYNTELIKSFKKKLSGTNIENSNANCDERSFSGRMNEAATVLLKDDALHNMTRLFRKNHEENLIYIHDLNSYSSGQHNCFDSATEFITNQGIRSFKNFTDGETVTVLAGDGEWRPATVKCYGHKKVQTVELEYHGSKKDMDIVTVQCTKDHRWYLKDDTVTTNLKVGDSLKQLSTMKDLNNITIETKEDAEMWCLGFIIGDGCDHYEYTQALLCNDKAIKYANIFRKAFYQEGKNGSSDRILFFKRLPVSKQTFLTNKMWKLLTTHQKQLLFSGYISADGNFSRNSEIASGCSTADERIVEFIKDLSCLCGYHIRRITEVIHDTNFKKDAKLTCIDFFSKQNHTGYWVVKSITPGTHNNSSVWCVEEPVTTSFTLAGGIVTGNCLSIPFDELLNKDIYTRQTGIRPPKSIQTACQLIAVIIQVQSLQQYGGVAATHLDWTLVPFVRYTFFKHLRDGHKYITKDNFKMPKYIEITPIDSYKEDPCYQYAYDLTVKDCIQGAEGLIHNLNSLQSRSGQQLPFSSINYGTCTSLEGRMITNAILDCTLDGTGPLHETPIFPCGIFQWDAKINGKPGTPNYDLFKKALYCTAKRFYPNYCNANWSNNVDSLKLDRAVKREVINSLEEEDYNNLLAWIKKNPVFASRINLTYSGKDIIVSDEPTPLEINSTMGCRTYNGFDKNFTPFYFKQFIIKPILEKGTLPEGELFSGNQKDGRGNIAPATIILPSVAMLAKGELGNKNIDSFMSKLDKKIHECRDELIERFTLVAKQSPSSAAFMYQNRTMAGYHYEEGIISALKHGTLVIGQLGLAECLQVLIGKDHTTPEGMELAHKIEALFKKRCAEFKAAQYEILDQKIYLNFGVYYTPAESLCHTALNKFKAKYGIIPNVSDKKFFTNSMHIPVWHNITPFEKIDLEAQLTGYSSGGCITYVELQPSAYNNIPALEKLVVYAMEKDIPYFALNPVVDSCRECGYSGEIADTCPKCGSKNILRLRRVTGYISNDAFTAFNDGKIDEVLHREKHVGDISCDC